MALSQQEVARGRFGLRVVRARVRLLDDMVLRAKQDCLESVDDLEQDLLLGPMLSEKNMKFHFKISFSYTLF